MSIIYTMERENFAPGFYDDHEWGVSTGSLAGATRAVGSAAVLPVARLEQPPMPTVPLAVLELAQQVEAGRIPSAVFLG